MNFINYFFEIVVPQLLEYFKENAKDTPYSLLFEVLINSKNYEKEVEEMIEKSKQLFRVLRRLQLSYWGKRPARRRSPAIRCKWHRLAQDLFPQARR